MINNIEKKFIEIDLEPSLITLDKLFCTLCEWESLDQNKPLSTLFNLNNSTASKRFIASCMLRIFDKCSDLFWTDQELRLKVVNLFDDVYSERLYSVLKIDKKQNNHEKFPIFRSISIDVLRGAEKVKNSIVSLETALTLRTSYMKFLNDPKTLIFTDHHIHDKSIVSIERISEFFNALEQYANASRLHKLATYKRLKDIFVSYETSYKKHPKNLYITKIISDIINAAFNSAKIDFNKSDLLTPAKVAIECSQRKYPLHSINQLFPIKFKLINNGPGVAFGLRVNVEDCDVGLELVTYELNVGDIDVGEYDLILNAKTISTIDNTPMIIGYVSWEDYKGERNQKEFEIDVTPQNGTIFWEDIKYNQPYSLESVESEEELIGRKDLLENISSKLKLRKAESSIIYGQKRVGKTSLARTIQNRFKNKKNNISIFIETGSLDKSTSDNFIKSLGEKIIKKISIEVQLSHLEVINFSGSLHPLVSFIEDIVALNKKLRIIIVLDEFDEIPSKLYPYTEAGDSFFHSIRSLSGESGDGRVALILVGSENMNIIMQSTDKLNKFDAWNVGYFDKSESWDDFRELVTAPVKDVMEYSDDAIVALYEMTEGNPFYTKFIAKTLYKRMCEKHCSYISHDEMNEAIRDTVLNMEAINVNHFWSDGVRVEDPGKKDLIETQRRRFLIALAGHMRGKDHVSKNEMINDASISSIPTKEILESFIDRNILVDEDGLLKIKPKLFKKWLVEKGIHSLRASFSDDDALNAYATKEEEAYITDSEIIKVTERWELYRGMEISSLNVRRWLDQFEDNVERRLVFKLLKNINFYGEQKIREKLKIIHQIIQKEIIYSFKSSERVRKDTLVSCFGTVSKSGPTYVRMYASENNITSHNIINQLEILKSIQTNEAIKALVLIDDIVASGGSIIDQLKSLDNECGEILKKRNILVIVGVICALSDGIDLINSQLSKFDFNIKLKACDIITSSDKAFSDESNIFSDNIELSNALTIARKYGVKLQKLQPLGFNNSQLLIVFKDNCPNNTLPIFWETSSNPMWNPLFKRG